MSAILETESFNRIPERPVHALFVGNALEAASKIFQRKDEIVRCDHAATSSIALEMIETQAKARPFDCVMVDMRHEEDGNPLNVVAIAALGSFGNLTVLANAENADVFKDMTGVGSILVAPIEPLDIIRTIVAAAPDVDPDKETFIEIPKGNAPPPGEAATLFENDGSKVVDAGVDQTHDDATSDRKEADAVQPASDDDHEKSAVTKGFESSLTKIQDADQQVWQRFVPLANFLYKKLAIIVLTALFLTFVTYGTMIVFFMVSSSWSMPFELSRGHVLVEKVERDLSSMSLRRNQVRQDLTAATVEEAKAARDRRDGQLQLTLTRRTVEEEILQYTTQRLEIKSHIERLKRVINDFNKLNGRGGFAKNLEGAFSKRLITKRALNSGTLAVLETLHRMATVQNEISVKQLELQKVTRALEFLTSLLEEIKQPEVRVITSAGSDLAHLAREVISAKTLIATSSNSLAAATKSKQRLENSLEVITANIDSLSATPAARAMNAPVMVLFVPYANLDNLPEGQSLYSCVGSIVGCSKIGQVGKPIDGETVSVHPLFGKPMRGVFIEAEFTDPKSVTAELVHAGGAPVLF